MYYQPPSKEPNRRKINWTLIGALAGIAAVIVAIIGLFKTQNIIFSQPSSTVTVTTAGSRSASPSVTRPPATPAYLMTLQPSAGPAPNKGVVVINNVTYQNSIWFTADEFAGVGAVGSEIDSTWELSGSYRLFDAWLGVTASVGSAAQVQYEVWLDGTRVKLWQVYGAQNALHVQVDTTNTRVLTLKMVEETDNFNSTDTVDWGAAQLS